MDSPDQLVSQGPSSKRKAKFAFGGLAVVLIVAGLIVWAITSPGSATFYMTVSEVHDASAATLAKEFRVNGYVVGGSVERDGVTTSFAITDGDETLDIVTDETLPDAFWSAYEADPGSIDIVAQGTYDGSQMAANQVLAKCPSKFETKA